MEYPIIETVKDFYKGITNIENHRFLSWEHCFKAFQEPKQSRETDYLSLQLAFYLASWGMYRGSSALLWKDYQIHYRTVDIIRNEKYDEIRCNSDKAFDIKQIKLIMIAHKEISEHYIKEKISPTDTLISKILLGTLGCVPAYDRLFKKGLSNSNLNQQFNEKSLINLFDYINRSENSADFNKIKTIINLDQKHKNRNDCYYPMMKIIDMYFWEVGRQIEDYKKNNGI